MDHLESHHKDCMSNHEFHVSASVTESIAVNRFIIVSCTILDHSKKGLKNPMDSSCLPPHAV